MDTLLENNLKLAAKSLAGKVVRARLIDETTLRFGTSQRLSTDISSQAKVYEPMDPLSNLDT